MPKNRTKIVSLSPFGLGYTKPHHYREMAEVAWENRDNLAYAWRILQHGVCDGCSLGPYGLYDNTMDGVHLCMTRLRMLRLNTMGALDPDVLKDVQALQRLSGQELRDLGRLPYPMIRNKGDAGFRRISWEEAMQRAAQAMTGLDPNRFALYTTSRGLTNEVYYVSGKFARLFGTNNVDNAARLCHAASTTALKQTVGVASSTNSYTDWIGAELIVVAGANISNNQPVATKYLYYAKQKGARIVEINPFREPGLERYWVPSVAKSALFGTRFTDDYFPILVGGDVAFYNGVLKILIENSWLDADFIRDHTAGFEELKNSLAGQSWELLEKQSGSTRAEMLRLAKHLASATTTVFIWSMGLTQHRFGVQNVRALVNLALARGMIGRRNVGLVPIRGHSGVQGAAEVGSVPGEYFAGMPVNDENARSVAQMWEVDQIPSHKGLSAAQMIDAAHESKLSVLYIMGGNFIDTMPDPIYAKEALERVPLRIHQDLILNSSMFADPLETVLLFPSQTRYEQKGGGTVTSTERRIRFSPEIPGPRIGECRCEWEILADLGNRVFPESRRKQIAFASADHIRQEMDRVIPTYHGVADLNQEGQSVQYGGEILLQGGVCPNLPDGRARFTCQTPENEVPSPNQFYLTTRRGKQFNSMIYAPSHPLIGAKSRDDIYFAAKDAAELNLKEGDRILLKSDFGQLEGVCRIGSMARRTLQAFWPEANVLLPMTLDPVSLEPDYNALVTVQKL